MPRQSASLTSGWARALVSSTAHEAGEEGGTPGNDAPPLSVTSPAPRQASCPHWFASSRGRDFSVGGAYSVVFSLALAAFILDLGGPRLEVESKGSRDEGDLWCLLPVFPNPRSPQCLIIEFFSYVLLCIAALAGRAVSDYCVPSVQGQHLAQRCHKHLLNVQYYV